MAPWRQLHAFIRLGRPLHLLGGVAFHGLGIAIARFGGNPIDGGTALCCQLVITASQLMTHYSNDYFDRDADAATAMPTRWSGGSRVLPEGHLPAAAARFGAVLWAAVALLAAPALAARSGAWLQTLGLALGAIALAWSYSSPPLWLNRRGLGELCGALLLPGLTSLLAFQVQAGRLTLLPLLAVAPLCCLQFAMLLAVNFPDAIGDARVGKRTLVVRLGPAIAARLFLAMLALAYLLPLVLIGSGLPALAAIAVWTTLPIAGMQVGRIRQGASVQPRLWEPLGFWSIGLLMSATLLEAAAFFALG